MDPDDAAPSLAVEVVFAAAPHQVDVTPLRLAPPASAWDAVLASGVIGRHGLDPATVRLGVWCRACDRDQPLRDRDRVELYRPLRVDPKEARRQRYKGQKARRSIAAES